MVSLNKHRISPNVQNIRCLTCSSVLRSPNSCMKVCSEGKRAGSRKWSRLKSSSTVFWRGVPVSRTLCSWGMEGWELTVSHKKCSLPLSKLVVLHTRFMSLKPSSSLQFLFLRRWASSMITQRHSMALSSGQPPRIISNVVMTALNL